MDVVEEEAQVNSNMDMEDDDAPAMAPTIHPSELDEFKVQSKFNEFVTETKVQQQSGRYGKMDVSFVDTTPQRRRGAPKRTDIHIDREDPKSIETFWDRYANCVTLSAKFTHMLCLIETMGDIFNFFVEFEYPPNTTTDELIRITQYLQTQMRNFFPLLAEEAQHQADVEERSLESTAFEDDPFSCVVCRLRACDVPASSSVSSVRIHFPGIVVTRSTASVMGNWFNDYLEYRAMSKGIEHIPIDLSRYHGTLGTRPLFSPLIRPCASCSSSARGMRMTDTASQSTASICCVACNSTGMRTEDSGYEPVAMVGSHSSTSSDDVALLAVGTAEMERMLAHTHSLSMTEAPTHASGASLREALATRARRARRISFVSNLCSLRRYLCRGGTRRETAGFVMTSAHPPGGSVLSKRKRSCNGEMVPSVEIGRNPKPIRTSVSRELQARERVMLQNLIRKTFVKVHQSDAQAKTRCPYTTVHVVSAFVDKSNRVHVYLCGQGAYFCQRIRGNHAGSRVYFVLEKGEIVQRCHNKDCKQFCSSSWRTEGGSLALARILDVASIPAAPSADTAGAGRGGVDGGHQGAAARPDECRKRLLFRNVSESIRILRLSSFKEMSHVSIRQPVRVVGV